VINTRGPVEGVASLRRAFDDSASNAHCAEDVARGGGGGRTSCRPHREGGASNAAQTISHG
jgi:hypothetical protein